MTETRMPVPEMPTHEAFSSVEVAALFKRFQPALVRFFERRSFSSSDSEDLVQEVFIKITRLDSSVNIWQPEAFLFQIAANVLRDRVRRDKARFQGHHVTLDDSVDIGEVASEESVYEGKESLNQFLLVLSGLTPKCRIVFLLHKYDGLSYSEIARRFDISVSAVEKHMIHAIKQLKQKWQGGL